jgi:hypothetical protein
VEAGVGEDLVAEARRLAALEHRHADDRALAGVVAVDQADGVHEARTVTGHRPAHQVARVVEAGVDGVFGWRLALGAVVGV